MIWPLGVRPGALARRPCESGISIEGMARAFECLEHSWRAGKEALENRALNKGYGKGFATKLAVIVLTQWK